MAHQETRHCAFVTERLEVGPWHRLAGRHGIDLAAAVGGLLTATTTAALPDDWRGDFDADRAQRWVVARDAESPTLLVVDRATGQPLGMVILFEVAGDDDGAVEVRLGYVLGESAWGRGLATELVGGLVRWARGRPGIGSLSGGVAVGNEASAKVLRRNGFRPAGAGGGEQFHRLDLRRP